MYYYNLGYDEYYGEKHITILLHEAKWDDIDIKNFVHNCLKTVIGEMKTAMEENDKPDRIYGWSCDYMGRLDVNYANIHKYIINELCSKWGFQKVEPTASFVPTIGENLNEEQYISYANEQNVMLSNIARDILKDVVVHESHLGVPW